MLINKRLDQLLVDKGLAPSRTKAQELIKLGAVEVYSGDSWTKVLKASTLIGEQPVRLAQNEVLKFVSRAGLKLEHALLNFKIEVKGLRALDIGQSTGGFTDCLLQHGIKEVVGIEVGHGQLVDKLKTNSKIKYFERLHIKDAPLDERLDCFKGQMDFACIDVSFIGLTQVLPHVGVFLKSGAQVVALVKPQFELSKKDLDKKGVVKNHGQYEGLRVKIMGLFGELNYTVIDYTQSPISGGDGNQEFLIYAKKN